MSCRTRSRYVLSQYQSPGRIKRYLPRHRRGVQSLIRAEFALTTGSFGLPTLTCFVPSLDAGSPFNISLHSWGEPEPSQYTQAYTQHAESCNWEARVFVDGRLLSCVPRPPPRNGIDQNDWLMSPRRATARRFSIARRNGPNSSVAALVINLESYTQLATDLTVTTRVHEEGGSGASSIPSIPPRVFATRIPFQSRRRPRPHQNRHQ